MPHSPLFLPSLQSKNQHKHHNKPAQQGQNNGQQPKTEAPQQEAAPEAVLVFIMPPTVEELEKRLRGRGDTSEEQIAMRLERAVWEMEQRSWYDHEVINNDVRACADQILNIIAQVADEK